MTSPSAYISPSGVGNEVLIPNFEGTKSSGDMNAIVPPSNCALHDIGWPGLSIMVIKPKSARQARGGVSLDIRIFACWMSKKGIGHERRDTDPFEVPVCEIDIVEVLQTLGCPVQLLSHLSEGSGGEAKSRTSSSLLTELFLIYSVMFPCVIHSDTVTNCPFSMSPERQQVSRRSDGLACSRE
jgi:hypothetical protein